MTGLDPAGLDEQLAAAVAAEAVPGVVAVVAGDDGPLYAGAFGVRDAATGDPVSLDTVFRIASMTKIATTLAALQLVEAGRLDLDAPVGDAVAAFDELAVIDGFEGGEPRLRPPTTRGTVRHLLTHTSGLAYSTWSPPLERYHAATGLPQLASGSRKGFDAPLVADPGAAFNYSTSTDWLGLVVEAVSGTTLGAYFEEHLFEPLGMVDTGVAMSAAQAARAAAVHVRADGGGWQASALVNGADPEFDAGGHCLVTTAPDYLRLQRALLGGGALDGVRVLGERWVAELFRNHIGDLAIGTMVSGLPHISADVALGEDAKWSLGLLVNPTQRAGLRSAWSGGWAGVYNTFFWIDPAARVTAAIYTQTLPFWDSGVVALATAFEEAVYRALRAS